VTGSVSDEGDPRLEYLPVILIVTTKGLEIDLLLPPTPTANIHWAQAWRPVPCRCGTPHAPCDPADLVLVIGARERTIHHHPDAFVIYVVPRPMRRVPEQSAQVVYGGLGGFGAWASDVIRNLVGPQSDPSIRRYDLADLRRMMNRSQSWACVAVEGDLPRMVSALVSLIPRRADELHVSISVPDTETIYLSDVSAALDAIERSIRPDISIISSCSWGARLGATAIFALDRLD
jgi:hypothetical protein